MNDSELRDKLLSLENVTPALEERYRKEVTNMLEQPLTPLKRIGWIIGGLFALGLAITIPKWYMSLPLDASTAQRLMMGVVLVFVLCWIGIVVSVLKRGSENLKTHGAFEGWVAWGCLVIMMVYFLETGVSMDNPAKGNQKILCGLTFWLMFAIPLVIERHVKQSEQRLREQILRLELELARFLENGGEKHK